ncbi:MAG: cytochrome ubiquinol oxidase subunit I [Thermoguttaceae bacterium]|nr:cytochrome ubiquinol oxidase subunit I [Thermoguttaceae bacterium]
MHYLWWYVPQLTAPMLIATIAVIHILVSHYAVGGGIFLASQISRAYREEDAEYLGYLRSHTKFFILLTVVFGAITGVGIWWTIGLASPLATEVLIKTFVFGWATEWVFFIVEIVSAFAMYYLWGRLDARTHTRIAWIYAIAAWISLVLITGITAFMLDPGWAVSRIESSGFLNNNAFWIAFFNPQFLPQTIARTGGALMVACLYVLAHATLTEKNSALREKAVFRSGRFAVIGAILTFIGCVASLLLMPSSARHVFEAAAPLTVITGVFVAMSIILVLLVFLGPVFRPKWVTPPTAIAMALIGVIVLSSGEFIREAVRKPYIIYNVVFSNQVFPNEVVKLQTEGYLENGIGTKQFVTSYAEKNGLDLLTDGRIDSAKLKALPADDPSGDTAPRAAIGESIFMHHCNDCHVKNLGYSAIGPLTTGWSHDKLLETIHTLHETKFTMPPWCGTDAEAELLADYLVTIRSVAPEGMNRGETNANVVPVKNAEINVNAEKEVAQ